jgi:predicted transposase YbfD/YdcC
MPRNPDKTDCSGGLPEGMSAFAVIEDPRAGNHKLHHFGEVLFMAVTATLCGMNGFAEIRQFCELQADWLKRWIRLPHGVPSAQAFSNLFALIDPDRFTRCLSTHIGTLCPGLQRRIIAIDGKSLRGSHGLGVNGSHAVSAWAADAGVTLAQTFVEEKSNELTAIPRLLEMLALEGSVVTIDAAGAHTDIAEKIVDEGGHYILALKGNQGNLHEEVADQFHFADRQLDPATSPGWSRHESVSKANGRITRRVVTATTDLQWIEPGLRGKWKGLASVVWVRTETTSMDDPTLRRETRYYISGLRAEAAEFGALIRLHWSIENQCHWVLDTAFREDHNRTRSGHAAKNLGSLRRIVLNLIKLDTSTKDSVPKKRLRALLDTNYRQQILSLA